MKCGSEDIFFSGNEKIDEAFTNYEKTEYIEKVSNKPIIQRREKSLSDKTSNESYKTKSNMTKSIRPKKVFEGDLEIMGETLEYTEKQSEP